jgi:hypothetical protein
MYTRNSDVLSGQANGSRVRFQKIHMKAGEMPFNLKLRCGTIINAVYASQIRSIEVKHENTKMMPATFQITTNERTFKARIQVEKEPMWQAMKGTQFPIISNTATTGHKLQGASLDALLVSSWHYGQNWAYVVLSRVRTMKGLYMNEELSLEKKKYAVDQDMISMIQKFREHKTLKPIDDDVYLEIEDDSFFSFIENEMTQASYE